MATTVLYAEDDANDIALVQMALQPRPDLDLQFVVDGVEAINYLAERGKFADRRAYPVPDVVLLDIKMPRLSGFDVLAWLCQQSSLAAIPVIAFSSSDQQSDIDKAYQLGVNAYVVKPSGFVRLQAVLLRTIDFFAHQRMPAPLRDLAASVPELREQ
jgi:CheY-like chemotaxis protein